MKIFRLAALLVSGLFAAQSVNAALVTLNDPGSTFSVTYDDAAVGLFGAPSLSSNHVTFSPATFRAQSTGPAITDMVSSTIVMTLNIRAGNQFDHIRLTERGDYRLNKVRFASVDVGGQIRVHDTADPVNSEARAFITETSGAYINDNQFHNWEAGASIDRTTSDWYKASEIRFTLENVLTAQALQFPDSAVIEKKLANGDFVTLNVVTVPLPAGILLLFTGIVSLLPVFGKRSGRSISYQVNSRNTDLRTGIDDAIIS